MWVLEEEGSGGCRWALSTNSDIFLLSQGFGRKVLEQQGWMEGQGLGSSNSGMAEALDNEGQNPRCKRGLG